jgi:hypothetical protein
VNALGWLACLIHKAEEALPDALVRPERVLPKFNYKHTIVLPRTASNKAVNLRLVKDANPVLEYRLMCVLNEALKTLSKDDKGGLGDWVGCVCQWRHVSHT